MGSEMCIRDRQIYLPFYKEPKCKLFCEYDWVDPFSSILAHPVVTVEVGDTIDNITVNVNPEPIKLLETVKRG